MSDTVDLDACAREPIHIPGSIQPYGALLVVDPADGRIIQASETAASVVGLPMAQLLGCRFDDVLALDPDPTASPLPGELPDRTLLPAEVGFPKREKNPEQPWLACWHLYPERWLVELEPRDAPLIEVTLAEAMPILRGMESDHSIAEISQRAAAGVRSLLGFDRVMVYRFDEEWNGDVIAEAKAPDLEAYLGLHYPHTDIPAQARALYLRNRLRQIADVGYTPSPIVPATHPVTGEAVDLSDVTMRSVSPVHVEYLGNMGVSATLVSSIVVNEQLWGLIACHHYSPHFCSHAMRDVTDAITRSLAGRVGALQAVARAGTEAVLMTVREKLITDFNEADEVTSELLSRMAPDLLDVVDADGVAIFHGDQVTRYGQLPDIEGLMRIRTEIERHHARELRDDTIGALHVEAIGEDFQELADLAPLAAGFIFVPLMPASRSALLWTRREQVQTVNWAGNPELSKLPDIPNSRLSPRKSFDLWQQTVRGRPRRWSPLHLESARNLRVLIELMERKRVQQDFSLLEASLSRLRDGVAIIEAGAPNRVTFVNPALASLADVEVSQMIGVELGSLYGEDADPGEVERIEDALRNGREIESLMPFNVHEQAPVLRQFQFEPLPASRGRVTHWLLQVRSA